MWDDLLAFPFQDYTKYVEWDLNSEIIDGHFCRQT